MVTLIVISFFKTHNKFLLSLKTFYSITYENMSKWGTCNRDIFSKKYYITINKKQFLKYND